MQLFLLIFLYALGALLPIIGISWTISRVTLIARQHRHRVEHKRKLQEEFDKRRSKATSTDEQQPIQEWFDRELDKKDRWDVPYRNSDSGGISASSPAIEAAEKLPDLYRDGALVISGLLAGTAASIWSLCL